MFGIVTVRREKPAGLWQAFKLRFWPRGAIACETDTVRMAMFVHVALTLPEKSGDGLVRRRLRRCMSLLRQRGVRRAVFPEQALQAAKEAGIARIESRQALQGFGAEAALEALRSTASPPEKSGVTLIAERAGRDVQSCALTLARRVRSVRVCTRVPAPALRRRLFEEYGIAEQLPQSDACSAAVVFEQTGEDLSGYGAVCNLTGAPLAGCGGTEYCFRLSCAPGIAGRKPGQADESDFAAALYLCGGLPSSEIVLKIEKRRSP